MWRHRGFNVYKLPFMVCFAWRWLSSLHTGNDGFGQLSSETARVLNAGQHSSDGPFESVNRQSFFLVQPSITLHKNHFEDGHAWYMTQNYPAKREVVEITQTWWLIQVLKSSKKIKHLQRHLTPWHFEPTCSAYSINAPHPLNSPTSGNSFLLPLNVSQVLTQPMQIGVLVLRFIY